jgi:hypothetical protein
MKVDRTKWRPITIAELKGMSDEEKSKLLSFAWDEYNKPRCKTIGITDVCISEPYYSKAHSKNVVDVSWSDNDGDPSLRGYSLNDKINRIYGTCEDYRYGLYIRI